MITLETELILREHGLDDFDGFGAMEMGLAHFAELNSASSRVCGRTTDEASFELQPF